MKKFLLYLVVSLIFTFSITAQCITNVDFNTWSKTGPANGNWVVQGGGSSVLQTINGDNTYFISPFDLMNVKITGNFKTTDGDDDYMGFVFSFLNPMGAIDDFDCWMYDWKEKTQDVAPSGMSINRILGNIPQAQYDNTFWAHQNTPEFTVVQNTFGGPGWNRGFNHAFELRLTYTRAIIYVDGNLIFDVTDCFKPGRFGFYNYSQKNCTYSNFKYDLFIDFFVDQAGRKCLGDSVSFEFVSPCYQASLSQYQSLHWDFGDGTTLTNNSPTFANANVKHRYATAGNYTAVLTVTDFNGCSSTATKQIQIANPITLTPTLTPPPCNGGSNGSAKANPSGGFGPFQYTWSTGQTTQTAIGLTAGTYTVTVTDNVCTTTGQYTLNQPTPVTATVSKTDANCGQSNGTATVTVSGGTTPYQYVNWPGLSSTNVATGLGAGTYIPDFKDANGCSALLQYNAVINSLPCGISSSVTKTDVTCFNGTNGSATLNVTGAVGTPNITWNPGGKTGATASNLTAGTYTYSFSDNVPGHAFSGTVTINQPTAAMAAQISTTPIKCAGTNTGQALASVPSGGIPPYNYTWSNGSANNPAANNLPPGNISVTITDSKGCTATASGTVSGTATLAISMATTMDSCFNSGKGKAIPTVTGGMPPYDFAWSNFILTDTNLNLRSGAYTLTVTDFNNCTATATANIATPPLLKQTFSLQNVNCKGQSTGGYTVNLSGGTTPYNIVWGQAGVTGTNPTGLAAGKYTYTVTDAHGCKIVGGDTIVEPDSVLVATSSHTDVTCNGLNNGTLTITVGGGTQPYSYAGNPVPAGTSTMPNLAPNTYTGIITDSKGCADTITEIITEPVQLVLGEQHGNVLCFGGNNANIDISVNGGTPSYTYVWNDSVKTEDRSNLTQGNYSITVTDAHNCTATISATITEPTELLASETHQDVACFGGNTGSVDVTVSGGTTPYTFTWNDGNGNEDRTALSQGNYSVTITDGNSCTKALAVTISEPTALTATTSHTNVTCNGLNNGTVTVNTSGGTPPYTFMGNPLPAGAVTLPNLAPNTYAGNITDSKGCTFTITETITEPTVLSATETHTDATCYGATNGSITLTTSGGTTPYTFDWGGGVSSQNRTNIGAGNYAVAVTDANSCTFNLSVTITEPSVFSLSETHVDVGCNGASTGSVDVTTTGGVGTIAYVWSNGGATEDLTGVAAGNYCLTATDNNACTATVCATISEPTALAATTSHTDVTCNGLNNGTVTVNTSGGTPPYTFMGNPLPAGAVTLPNLAPNTYAGNITDSKGCTFAITETITEPTALSATETHTDATCNGATNGSITLTVSGGTAPYTFDWGGGVSSQDRTNIGAGNYTVTVTDANNCTFNLSVNITEPAAVALAIAGTDASCFGATGSATASPTEGIAPFIFVWSGSSSTTATASLPAGTHTATSTASNGCKQTGTVTINQPSQIAVSETHVDVDCNSGATGSVRITASGGVGQLTYQWQPNVSSTDTAVNLVAGSYQVVVSDGNNCTTTITAVVVEPVAIQLATTDKQITCFSTQNGEITATATGGNSGFNYTAKSISDSLSSSSGQFTSLKANTYTVIVTDSKNCSALTTVTITEPNALTLNSQQKDVTCHKYADGNVQYTAAGGTPSYSFKFSTGESNNSGLFTNLKAGNYTVTVTDQNQCSLTNSISITEPDSVQVTALPNPTSTSLGVPVQLNVTSNQAGVSSYTWIPATGLSCSDCDNPTFNGIKTVTYTVFVTTSLGCSGSSDITATVVPDYTVFVPNTFSPNNDGTNDFLQVYGNTKGVKLFEFKVFNRWGEMVYESTDVNQRWDGFSGGKKLLGGVYVYTLKYVFIDNHTSDIYKGTITILD
ncbi:MAG: hypothetical protein BGO32_02245 [Bacteroidetes bacterium 37-13]|nr:MAG: hypothetical protein BGO32_02245 [Bacteroidetes bacterium 37-13]